MTRAVRTLALLVGFGGCATGHVVIGPDGQPAIQIACHRHQYRCAEKADRICAGRYQVLDNGVRPENVVMANGAVATMQPVFHGYIVVRCQ